MIFTAAQVRAIRQGKMTAALVNSQNDYRWYLEAPTYVPTILVIEPAAEQAEKAGRRVPFGFARALGPGPVEREPLLWEGDGA